MLNQSENGKYKLISVRFNAIPKIFPRVCGRASLLSIIVVGGTESGFWSATGKPAATRETGVSRQHGNPIQAFLKPLWPSQRYDTEGFRWRRRKSLHSLRWDTLAVSQTVDLGFPSVGDCMAGVVWLMIPLLRIDKHICGVISQTGWSKTALITVFIASKRLSFKSVMCQRS